MAERRRSSKARSVAGTRNGHHRTAVLLEEIQSQMRIVMERVLDTPTKREFNERLDGIDQELRALRHEVSRNDHGSELRAIEQRLTVLERHARL
jgi:hypothetical protein